MISQKFPKQCIEGYRFAFNGKESDDEAYGDDNFYDYGFRVYDPRIARFLSVDPLFKSYPWFTPYQFAGNKPIQAIDIDGLENYDVTGNQISINGVRVAYTCATFDILGHTVAGGNITTNFDVEKLYRNTYSSLNGSMQKSANHQFLDIGYGTNGSVNYVKPGSTEYTVQFNIKAIVVNSTEEFKNNAEIQESLKNGSFMGLVSHGPVTIDGSALGGNLSQNEPAANYQCKLP